MHRQNNTRNQRSEGQSRPVSNDADDDSRSQVDSDTSGHDQSASLPSDEEQPFDEERLPFVSSENDADEYVKRLRKTGTADNVSSAVLTQGMGMLAAKTGASYLTKLGLLAGKGGTDDVVDEDDIIGGGMTATTKLNPSQQQMMNQMAPQASGAAGGGIAGPMMSVVVPTPLGSAMASSAATTTAAASQAAVVATTAATVAAAASVAAAGYFTPSEAIFPSALQNGTIPASYIHESGNGIKREFLPLLERSFEEAYIDMFEETVIATSFADCLDELENVNMDCIVVCDNPEWCCESTGPGLVECPFGCSFLRPDGVSVFNIGGALTYEVPPN